MLQNVEVLLQWGPLFFVLLFCKGPVILYDFRFLKLRGPHCKRFGFLSGFRHEKNLDLGDKISGDFAQIPKLRKILNSGGLNPNTQKILEIDLSRLKKAIPKTTLL